jgi:hypothetical protein
LRIELPQRVDFAQDMWIGVKLEVAGDDFRVVDFVTKAMRRAGIQPKEIEGFGRKRSRQRTGTSCGFADDG